MDQIKQAWQMGAAKGASKAHKNFPDQMAIKTVMNRALKLEVSSTSDVDLYSDGDDYVADASQSVVEENNATEDINFETVDDAVPVEEVSNENPEGLPEKKDGAIQPQMDF